MNRTSALLSLLTLTGSACFDPADPPSPPIAAESDDGGISTTGGAATDSNPDPSSADSSGGTTPTEGTSESGDASSSGPGDPDTEGSTGDPQLGPQLEMSTPQDGDLDAGLDGYFLLHFDRPISQNDALGHIFVTQGDGEPVLVAPQPCPPDADPQCVAGIFPAGFVDPEGGDLPGSTEHSIIVAADLPDLDGNTNTVDQVVEFRTFEFTNNFFDDSAAIPNELGGLVYDPTQDALFVAGVPGGGGDCIVRRVDLDGGAGSPASTVASPVAVGGGPYCYGLQLSDDTLFVDMSYSGDVRAYANTAPADLNPLEVLISDPTLPAPHDTLSEVIATAQIGSRRFFSFGNFTGGPDAFAILELSGGTWSIFQDGSNLWLPGDDVSIAAAQVEGTPYLFAHAGSHIYKFRASDATLAAEIEVPRGYDADVEVDGFGRLYVGTNGRFAVYDTGDLAELEVRQGLDTGRIGIDAGPAGATVYFARYRGPAVIGRMTVTF